jgi:hypothetical protein
MPGARWRVLAASIALAAAAPAHCALRNTAMEIWTNAGTIVNIDIAPYVFPSMQRPLPGRLFS